MKRFGLIAMLCGTIDVVAAQTYQDQKHQEHKKSVERVGGGAAGGAVIGAIAGGKKGALIGAAAGGGTGAVYDHHKKKQARQR